MTEVIVTTLNADKKRRVARTKLRSTRIHTKSGKVETLYRLDVSDESFPEQFAKAFQRSVDKARRENKRVLGTRDIEPPRD